MKYLKQSTVMMINGRYAWVVFFIALCFLGCDKNSACRDSTKEVFNAFEDRLKIDPGVFKMASALDTVDFQVSIDFDGFTGSSGLLRLCTPTEYENYWANLGNGSYLNLFKDNFQMQLVGLFDEERFFAFQLREDQGVYRFFEPFTENILEGHTIEILPVYEFNGNLLQEVVRIQAENNGEILEELLYQREQGFLYYRNTEKDYAYRQIRG